MEIEIERLTTEHANTTEQLIYQVNQSAKESEESKQQMQMRIDAAVMQKNSELDQLKEQFTLLEENNIKEVCTEGKFLKPTT